MIMNFGAKGAENFFSIENGQFFFNKYMANDEPPGHADSKSPIFIVCRILGPGHPRPSGQSR